MGQGTERTVQVGSVVAWIEERHGSVLQLAAMAAGVVGGLRICFGVIDELVATEPPTAMVREDDGGPRYISLARLQLLPPRYERCVEIDLASEIVEVAPEAAP